MSLSVMGSASGCGFSEQRTVHPAKARAAGSDGEGASAPTAAVQRLEVSDQSDYWQENGYVEMVPTIPLPTSHDRVDSIRTVLRLPEQGKMSVRWLAEQERFSLSYPPGTRAARVEGLAYTPDGQSMTITDVRGVHKASQELEWFFVLRPTSGESEAPLVGWEWPRGEESAHEHATKQLLQHARTTRGPMNDPPYDASELRRLEALNDCKGCHTKNRPRQVDENQEVPARRATDQLGLYLSASVLTDSCAVATHRPENRIDEDPFVTVRCGGQIVEESASSKMYDCPGDAIPIATRDVTAAMAQGHPYTERVCASRRWLFEHMTPEARTAFQPAFRGCGITEASSEAAAKAREMLAPRM